VRDRSGKASSGSVYATDEDDLRRILRANDLYLTSAKEVAAKATTEAKASTSLFSGKVVPQDMVIALRQLATLVKSGVPLNKGLEIVAAQTTKPKLLLAWRDIQLGVNEGQSLSMGMRKYPSIFRGLVVSLVEAGETAGTLEYTLEVAAQQIDREDNLNRKVKAAMFYPKLVVLAAVFTVIMMLLLVVPVFANVYKELKADLPVITTMLIKVSDVFVRYWYVLVILMVGSPFAYKQFAKTGAGSRFLDVVALKLPVLGILFRKIAIARVVQTLAGAISGGVPILKSLGISANTAGNTVIRDAVMDVAAAVRDGAAIGPEMEKTGQFPLMVTRMIQAGEETSNLDDMLNEVNTFYERDVEYEVEKLTRMIEPAMTFLVGGIVLFVLLALYSPIFNLGRAFKSSEGK
jgi:type IV pilus assembly protein PilC